MTLRSGPPSNRWVTLYTDASLKNGEAAWAIWARSDLGRIVASGEYPGYCEVSDHAELYAIHEGVRIVMKEWRNVLGIQVNSDSKNALATFEYPTPTKDPVMVELWMQIEDLIYRVSPAVKLRGKWVKAHQVKRDVRAYLNNACDRIAKDARSGNTQIIVTPADQIITDSERDRTEYDMDQKDRGL